MSEVKTAYVAVGAKHGDMCNILSCIGAMPKHDAVIIVSEKYKDMAKASGIESVVFKGEWHDLRGALQFAKRKYRKVVNLSTFGYDFPIAKRLPSFQLDQWHRGGVLKEFGKCRLSLNSSGPCDKSGILLCLESESSPFPHAAEVEAIILEMFPDVEIKKPQPCKSFDQLLEQINSAKLAIFCDSGPLHLSSAGSTPVMAFATDKPSRWHGSAYHPRMSFHCRYSDFNNRIGEFKKVAARIMHDMPSVETHEITGLFAGGYNPSIIENDGKILMAYRYHQEASGRSQIGIATLDRESLKVRRNAPLAVPEIISKYSVEDPRLFRLNGRLHMSYTLAKFPMPPFLCVVGYGELENIDGTWTLKEHRQIKYGRNDFSGMEKNWLFFESVGKLYAIYSENEILEIRGDAVVKVHKPKSLQWKYGKIKGGCLVPFTTTEGQEKFLRFFHSRSDWSEKPVFWHYRIGCALMDAIEPFDMTNIESEPVITGDEFYRMEAHWKPNVVFPAGAVVTDSGNGKISLLLSYGHNDSSCVIAKLNERHLI